MLNKDSLRAGANRAVDIYLPTQSAPSGGTPQVLRVVPNWLASTSSLRIWASYRTREGGDDDMGTTLTGKVHIYTGSINAANQWVVTNWEASLTRAWDWVGVGWGGVVGPAWDIGRGKARWTQRLLPSGIHSCLPPSSPVPFRLACMKRPADRPPPCLLRLLPPCSQRPGLGARPLRPANPVCGAERQDGTPARTALSAAWHTTACAEARMCVILHSAARIHDIVLFGSIHCCGR